MSFTVYQVVTNQGESRVGSAQSPRHAVELTCKNFLCPYRSIVRVEKREILPVEEKDFVVLYDAEKHGTFHQYMFDEAPPCQGS